jgi:phosphoserine aminotransferase
MIAVEDQIDALKWSEDIGGLPGLVSRTQANLEELEEWVARTPWVGFLAEDAATRSSTSICLTVVADWFTALSADDQAAAAKKIVSLLDKEGAAFDIGAYRDAPPGLRIWGGATVETSDIAALCPWLEWAYATVEAQYAS